MVEILEAFPEDFTSIQNIARKTWPATYSTILLAEQLDFMLNKFYSVESLTANSAVGHKFLLAKLSSEVVGFAGYKINYKPQCTHLHKLYVMPEMQGRNIGEKLLKSVEGFALQSDQVAVSLNVNRFNKAITFYQKVGYSIVESVDIEIGNGYLMEDFIMKKAIV